MTTLRRVWTWLAASVLGAILLVLLARRREPSAPTAGDLAREAVERERQEAERRSQETAREVQNVGGFGDFARNERERQR